MLMGWVKPGRARSAKRCGAGDVDIQADFGAALLFWLVACKNKQRQKVLRSGDHGIKSYQPPTFVSMISISLYSAFVSLT